MSSVPVTIQAVGPHDEENHSVALTAKLITARWNQKLENLVLLERQLEEFKSGGGLDHSPFDDALKNEFAPIDQAVEDLDDTELTALHSAIGKYLVKAITADTVIEIVHPITDAHGNPAAAPLLFNMIQSHGDVPENYGGLLAVDTTEMFYAPVTENEMEQYVRGEAGLTD